MVLISFAVNIQYSLKLLSLYPLGQKPWQRSCQSRQAIVRPNCRSQMSRKGVAVMAYPEGQSVNNKTGQIWTWELLLAGANTIPHISTAVQSFHRKQQAIHSCMWFRQ